jgi:phosphoribosyl 1,2-cyclic phosphodiesterase
VRFQVIASGSNGNCSVLHTDHGAILIDAGISRKRILDALETMNVPLSDIRGILITHAHSDHISGLAVLHDYIDAPVIAPPETLDELRKIEHKDPRFGKTADRAIPLPLDQTIEYGGFSLRSHPIFHDIAGSTGFSVLDLKSEQRLSYATDTSGLTNTFLEDMRDSQIVVLESNHEENLLWASRRPNWLKERIRSTHLSNKETMKYLPRIISEKTEAIFLAHLSGQCNTTVRVAQYVHHHWQNQTDFDQWHWAICPRNDSSSIYHRKEGKTELIGGLTSITNPDVLDQYPIEVSPHDVESFFS